MTRRTRRHTSLGDTLLRLADVIGAFGILGARLIGGLERLVARYTATAREALHEQGLALKNQLTAHKIAHEQEKIHLTVDKQVESSYKIDLLALKVRREKWAQRNMGIDQADRPHDPDHIE